MLIERGTLFQFHQKHTIISVDGECPLVQLVVFQNLVFHAVMKHYMNRSLHGTLIRTVSHPLNLGKTNQTLKEATLHK